MSSATTTGPWHAIIAANEQPSLLYAGIISVLHFSPDPDGYVAVVADEPLGMGEASLREECQANACLISAAPDLLRAVEEMAAFLGWDLLKKDGKTWSGTRRTAQDAYRKAIGHEDL